MKTEQPNKYGDEAPALKHVLIVLLVFAALVAFGWVSWHWLGWFH